jgi:hypothetical protein
MALMDDDDGEGPDSKEPEHVDAEQVFPVPAPSPGEALRALVLRRARRHRGGAGGGRRGGGPTPIRHQPRARRARRSRTSRWSSRRSPSTTSTDPRRRGFRGVGAGLYRGATRVRIPSGILYVRISENARGFARWRAAAAPRDVGRQGDARSWASWQPERASLATPKHFAWVSVTLEAALGVPIVPPPFLRQFRRRDVRREQRTQSRDATMGRSQKVPTSCVEQLPAVELRAVA